MNYHEDFYDLKELYSTLGCVNLAAMKINDVKIFEVRKESPNSVFFKKSYNDQEFENIDIIKRKRVNRELQLKPAFTAKPGITERKKSDLMELVNKKHIPSFYKSFFENL